MHVYLFIYLQAFDTIMDDKTVKGNPEVAIPITINKAA